MNEVSQLNNDYGLAEMHADLLSALKVLDNICRDNRIFYSLHGGTLLGAERDHHFIPWDDDADISMTIENFDKLKRILRMGKLSEEYYLDECALWVPRFVKKTKNDFVCVDILIWGYISENKLLQVLKINLLRFLQGMLKDHLELGRFGIKEKFLLTITHVVGKPFKKTTKIKWLQFIGRKMFLGKKQYIHRYNDSFKGVKHILDKRYMEEYTDITFEDVNLMVNKRYKEFLIAEYGPNYLIPPPEKDRHPLHEKIREAIRRNN